MKTLPINLTTFGFVTREKDDVGRTITNRCGRDFLYYALHYLYPDLFAPEKNSPTEIDRRRMFGFPLPSSLVWTCLPFYKIPSLFKNLRLALSINGEPVQNFFQLFIALAGSHSMTADEGFSLIERAIDDGHVAGIDISLGLGGLKDHVMFVYGYDTDSFYVFDTHIVPELEYIKTTRDERFIMKLPRFIARERWTRWSRAWVIQALTD